MTRTMGDGLNSLGFLTVVETDDGALVGGLLILNATGRPLEFHCTTPVRTNRAQQILYGPTLQPFLYGEQIAVTLLSKANAVPLAVFLDQPPTLAARTHVDVPLALVADHVLPEWAAAGYVVAEAGPNRIAAPRHSASDVERIQQRMAALPEVIDLCEPFERIREAIAEARRDAKARMAAPPPTTAPSVVAIATTTPPAE